MYSSLTRTVTALILAGAAAALSGACTPRGGSSGAASSSPKNPATAGPTAMVPASSIAQSCKGSGVVKLKTADGVVLEADLHTSSSGASDRAVVLLHMIPPDHNRADYPAAFINRLVASGFAVLNVDRRGAGNSGGNAQEAYLGIKGAADASAARYFLHDACKIASSKLSWIGASNGTTTIVDLIAMDALTKGIAERPTAIVLMTPGQYTENQIKHPAIQSLFGQLQVQFMYGTAEAAWSNGYKAAAPDNWNFKEYPDGKHGTLMLSQPSVPATRDIESFLLGAYAAADAKKMSPPVPPLVEGAYESAACGSRKYTRTLTFLADGKAQGQDRISPCPLGTRCVWSGIVDWKGTFTAHPPRGLTLNVTTAKPNAAMTMPLPRSMRIETDGSLTPFVDPTTPSPCRYTKANAASAPAAGPK